MNRTKTKKWVEAKTQNYDGDDWGADEYEEEEEDPEPQPPLPQPPSQLPSQKAANTDKNLPSLQTQTVHPVTAVSMQPKPGAVTSPLVSDPSSAGTGMTSNPAQVVSPQSIGATQSFGSVDDSQRPPSQTGPDSQASSDKPLPFVRPSDIYRRMEVEKERERQSMDSSRSHPTGVIDQPRGRSPSPTKHIGADEEIDRRRLSTSPKLPDLARMSAFGPDLFGSGTTSISVDKTITEHESEAASPPTAKAEIATPAAVVNQAVPGEPSTVVRDTAEESKPTTMTAEATSQVLPSVDYDPKVGSESSPTEAQPDGKELSAAAGDLKSPTADDRPVLEPKAGMHGMQEIPPLRTPSPRGPKTAGPGRPSEASKDSDAIESTPTKLGKGADFEPPSAHRQGTFSTTTSSPVKDNDVLSDEILKSLSPVGSAPHNLSRKDTRDSTYTLKDYDSYWEDTGDKSGPSSAVPPIPEAPDAQAVPEAPAAAETRPDSPPPAAEETIVSPSSGIRRKFSWEAEEEPAATQSDERLAPVPVPVIVSAATTGGLDNDKEAALASHPPNQVDTGKPGEVASRALGVSHQVSTSSSIQPGSTYAPVLEAPSPISAGSDMNTPEARESTRISVADDRALEQKTSSVVPTTAPPEAHAADVADGPALASPLEVPSQPAQPQIMSFREILNLPTTAERIAKYNESRSIFSSTDSGLDNWIVNLKTQHPELVNGGPQFSAPPSQSVHTGSNPGTPAGSQAPPPAQQPYYQQYLNASSPGRGSPTGRNRVGAQPSQPQSSGSAFGASGNQIGTKSKEFMHSAGKMGKGLLSKGRSKLRGTGDKVFH